MKRFTLLFVAAIVSVASFAQQRSGKAFFSQLRAQRTAKMAQLSGVAQVSRRANVSSAFAQAFANRSSLAKRAGARKAESSTPYEEGKYSYVFSSSYQYIKGVGLATVPLDTTVVYSKLSKDSIFVDLLSKGWGFIGAKVYKSSIEGIDSLEFAPGQVVGTLKDGTKLSIYSATYTRGLQGYEFSRTDDPIVAYYDPESGTIMSDGSAIWGVFAGEDATEAIDSCYRMNFSTVGLVDDVTPYKGTRTLSCTVPAAYSETGKDATETETNKISFIPSIYVDENGKEKTTYYIKGLSSIAAYFGDWQSLTLGTSDDGKSPVLTFIGLQYLPNEGSEPIFTCPGTADYYLKDSLSYVGTFNNDSTVLTFTQMNKDDRMFDLIQYKGKMSIYQYPETISSFTLNFPKETTSVRGVKINATGKVREEYFDLAGRRVDASYKGLVIRRTVDASGKTEVRKIIRN